MERRALQDGVSRSCRLLDRRKLGFINGGFLFMSGCMWSIRKGLGVILLVRMGRVVASMDFGRSFLISGVICVIEVRGFEIWKVTMVAFRG
jgi:hypothetical protein